MVSGIISILLESVTSPCISFGSSGLLLLTPALLMMLVKLTVDGLLSQVSVANLCC